MFFLVVSLKHLLNCLIAGVIAISWIMSCKISMVRKQLKETRKLQLKRFKIRAKVHPSLSFYRFERLCFF